MSEGARNRAQVTQAILTMRAPDELPASLPEVLRVPEADRPRLAALLWEVRRQLAGLKDSPYADFIAFADREEGHRILSRLEDKIGLPQIPLWLGWLGA